MTNVEPEPIPDDRPKTLIESAPTSRALDMAQGAGSPGDAEATEVDPRARRIYALGLFSMVCCQVTGPIAWVLGNGYLRDCRRAGRTPERLAVMGRLLGITSTLLTLAVLAAIALTVYLIGIDTIKENAIWLYETWEQS